MNRRRILHGAVACAGVLLSRNSIAFAGPVRRSVIEFGAVGDGKTLNTAPIQRAIDVVAAAGGGLLEVPSGKFVIGTLVLKTGVVLSLQKDAVLLGSLNPADYQAIDPFLDAVDVQRGYALIAAIDAERVGITGEGVVDGRGVELQQRGKGPDAKPFLIRWVRCAGVEVSGVTLKNAGAWTMHAFQSRDVHYRGVHVFSFGVENNDGFDIDSCERVRIDDCLVESQDDAICIKTTSVRPCRDVTVSNCTIRTHHGALKIGTESLGDVEDIRFLGCHVIDAREGAVKFCSEDGANIRRVLVSDLRVDLADTPIFLRLGGRMRKYRKDDPTRVVGSMSGIELKNIHIADSTRVGVLVSGIPGHPVQNVTMSDVYVKLKGEINTAREGEIALPEQVEKYPEVWMFGPLIPAYGAYVRHAEGLRMSNVEVKVELPDRRPALVFEDVTQCAVRHLDLTGAPAPEWVVTLREAREVDLDRVAVPASAKTFARVQGAGTRRIRLLNESFGGDVQPFALEDGATGDAVSAADKAKTTR